MCDVVGVLGIFCGVPRESECFYINVVMEQMFLTVRGDVRGSFRVTLDDDLLIYYSDKYIYEYNTYKGVNTYK